MNIKTTEQIKRQNDYKYKKWVEADDIYIELNKIISELDLKRGIVLKKDENEINDKLRELSQRVSKSNQSVRMQREKLDKIYKKVKLESEEIRKKVNNVWELVTNLNDRIRILEEGRSLLDDTKK